MFLNSKGAIRISDKCLKREECTSCTGTGLSIPAIQSVAGTASTVLLASYLCEMLLCNQLGVYLTSGTQTAEHCKISARRCRPVSYATVP